MKRIDLDHWYLDKNRLNISLMNIVASIELDYYNKCCLTVKDEDDEYMPLEFSSMEKAVLFVEEYIKKCRKNEEIIKKYEEFSKDNEIEEKKNKEVFLFPEDIDREIIDYYSNNGEFYVSVKDELTVKDGQPDIAYYLIQHSGCDATRKVRLTEGNLKNVFSSYADRLNYDLEDFKYCGGIHRVGYYFDNDPYFEGIKLFVKDKEKGNNHTKIKQK